MCILLAKILMKSIKIILTPRPKIFEFVDIVLSPDIDPKTIFLHRSHAIGAPGALFRLSQILTQNFQILDIRYFAAY